MKLRHILGITTVAAACILGLVDARGADTGSPNPPRTQQEIMKQRYAACRDLHGSALQDCMANYVGTPEKNPQDDREAHNETSQASPQMDNHQKGTANE